MTAAPTGGTPEPTSAVASPEIAFIVVTYTSGDTLDDFIASVPASTTRPYRIYLSDNGSTDGAPEAAVTRWPNVTLVLNNANLGYGRGVNRAAAILPDSVEWIAVCNPDSRLEPGSMDTLIELGIGDPQIGSLGPQIVGEDGEVYPSARRLPSLRSGVGHALFALPWPSNPWTHSYHSPGRERTDGTFVAGWLSGACVLVRRDAFRQIGGFDEDFFMYFEDVDLGLRLRKSHWVNVYAPQSRVVHIGGTSTRKQAATMIRAHHASAYLYLAKTHPGWYLAPVRWVLYWGLAARSWWLRRA